MHNLSYQSDQTVRHLRRLSIGLGITIVAAFISACGNEESRTYIPPEAVQCIEYTKKAIEARGERYSRYTDRTLEDGEPVWVAGRRFDFGYVRDRPGKHNPTFISSDAWARKGKFLPGVTAIYDDSVEHMKETMPGVILSGINPSDPNIIIKMDCLMGATPSTEEYAPIDILANKLIGGPSGYAISLNEELGFYQALGQEKHAFDYFYMHRAGAVDMRFPLIFCGKDLSTGICSAKITAWKNIVLFYRFPRRQLSDFTRIYQVTKGKIDAALAKGEQ
jgi:hypothetical protein